MNIIKTQALINKNSDNYYWVYKDGNLESTNCRKSKYRLLKNYLKRKKDKPAVKK